MKKLLFIFVLLLELNVYFAQDTNKLRGFREIILPEFSDLFKEANFNENGKLVLISTEKYMLQSVNVKTSNVASIMNAWQDSIIFIKHNSKRELWGWDTIKGNVKLYDSWDLNFRPLNLKPPVVISERSHPWFVYIGGQFGGDNQKNINIVFNARVGFFLLLNRWDLASSVSAGVSDNTAAVSSGYNTSTTWSNLGLMTRVHFPIRKIGLSPNIGFEVSKSVYGEVSSDAIANVVLGFRWFVGFGSVDIGIKLGEETSGMGGYTIVPQSKGLKK